MKAPWNFEEPACAEVGGDFWFPELTEPTKELQLARKVCGSCIHKTECLEWAIVHERHGIWGGTTPRARAQMRRMREDNSVKSD